MKKLFLSMTVVLLCGATGVFAESYAGMLRAARSTDQIVEAMYHLSYYGNKSCFWDFVRYLNYSVGEDEGGSAFVVRKAAAEALGRTRDERAVKHLVERYGKEKNNQVKSSILFGLSFHSDPAVLPVILDGLKSTDEGVRYQAVIASVQCNKKDTIPSIQSVYASSKDDSDKIVAAYALYMLGSDRESNKNIIIAGLGSSDSVVRFRAVDFIGRAGIEDAQSALIKAAEIENKWWVRVEIDRTMSLLYDVKRKKREAEDAKTYEFITDSSDKKSDSTENKTPAPAGGEVKK